MKNVRGQHIGLGKHLGRTSIVLAVLLASSGVGVFAFLGGDMETPELVINSEWKDGDGTTLLLVMEIPSEHHAYLPESELGLPIIVAAERPRGYPRDVAEWPKEGNGYTIAEIRLPEGEEYEDDIVLRGTVTYEVDIDVDDLDSSSLLYVTYQLCDDKTLVCYPPKVAEVSVAR